MLRVDFLLIFNFVSDLIFNTECNINMNTLLICDGCNEPFDCQNEDLDKQRIPLMLRNCGHTLCSQCIREIFNDDEANCSVCFEMLAERKIEECR